VDTVISVLPMTPSLPDIVRLCLFQRDSPHRLQGSDHVAGINAREDSDPREGKSMPEEEGDNASV
jgi:hypothetical protein